MDATSIKQFSLNEEEQRENTERQSRLIDLISANQSILLVGAGSSARLGYPLWQGLLIKLETLANTGKTPFATNDAAREDDPLVYADKLKDHIQSEFGNLNKYHQLIDNTFKSGDKRCDDFHKALLRLPFRTILTTNYDVALECAALDIAVEDVMTGIPHALPPNYSIVLGTQTPSSVSEYLLSTNRTLRERRIVHLHGKHDEPDSIILSRNDYKRFYGTSMSSGENGEYNGTWTLHRKLLWAILATRNVVFIGFSMTDEYLNGILQIVSNDLWRWGEATHFAIMDISPGTADRAKLKQRQLKDDYGIDVVFYEVVGGSHESLSRLVSELQAACSTRSDSAPRHVTGSTAQAQTETQQSDEKHRAPGSWRRGVNEYHRKLMSHEY